MGGGLHVGGTKGEYRGKRAVAENEESVGLVGKGAGVPSCANVHDPYFRYRCGGVEGIEGGLWLGVSKASGGRGRGGAGGEGDEGVEEGCVRGAGRKNGAKAY